MDRRKVKRVLLWSGLVLITLAGGAYWGINTAMDKLLHAFAPDVKASHEEKQISIQTAPAATPAATPAVTPAPTPIAVTSVPGDKQAESSAATSSTAYTGEPVTTKESPSATTAPTTPTPTPAPSIYVGSISEEKAEKAKEQITIQEKALVTSIFLKRFNPQELSAFMSLARGGLSIPEKAEAKQMVLNKLSEDEYNQLISIAAKLNLSQGKSYKDSLNEFPTPTP